MDYVPSRYVPSRFMPDPFAEVALEVYDSMYKTKDLKSKVRDGLKNILKNLETGQIKIKEINNIYKILLKHYRDDDEYACILSKNIHEKKGCIRNILIEILWATPNLETRADFIEAIEPIEEDWESIKKGSIDDEWEIVNGGRKRLRIKKRSTIKRSYPRKKRSIRKKRSPRKRSNIKRKK